MSKLSFAKLVGSEIDEVEGARIFKKAFSKGHRIDTFGGSFRTKSETLSLVVDLGLAQNLQEAEILLPSVMGIRISYGKTWMGESKSFEIRSSARRGFQGYEMETFKPNRSPVQELLYD